MTQEVDPAEVPGAKLWTREDFKSDAPSLWALPHGRRLRVDIGGNLGHHADPHRLVEVVAGHRADLPCDLLGSEGRAQDPDVELDADLVIGDDAGPIQIARTATESVTIPPLAAGGVAALGLVLTLVGSRRQ